MPNEKLLPPSRPVIIDLDSGPKAPTRTIRAGSFLPFSEKEAARFADKIVLEGEIFFGKREDIDVKPRRDFWNTGCYLQVRLGNPGPLLIIQSEGDWLVYRAICIRQAVSLARNVEVAGFVQQRMMNDEDNR